MKTGVSIMEQTKHLLLNKNLWEEYYLYIYHTLYYVLYYYMLLLGFLIVKKSH